MKHPSIARWCTALASALLAVAALRAQAPDGHMMPIERVKAFVGARVIDGTTRAPIDNGVIVVNDGRVVSVGPLGRVTIPANAQRITLTGKTVIPGLVNA